MRHLRVQNIKFIFLIEDADNVICALIMRCTENCNLGSCYNLFRSNVDIIRIKLVIYCSGRWTLMCSVVSQTIVIHRFHLFSLIPSKFNWANVLAISNCKCNSIDLCSKSFTFAPVGVNGVCLFALCKVNCEDSADSWRHQIDQKPIQLANGDSYACTCKTKRKKAIRSNRGIRNSH